MSGSLLCDVKCTSADTSFARTVSEPVNPVSADMLISMHLHESSIGGFGDSQDHGSAVWERSWEILGSGLTAPVSDPGKCMYSAR